MEVSINSAVNAGLAVKDLQLAQEVQARLLKKVLNTQADTMATLLGSLPALATEGSLGTRVNTYA
ncbi:putative motility protein [Achromobacter marplatensis]